MITHKPRKCLGSLVNHLRKEKQTSYCLALLVLFRGVLEKGLLMSKVKWCLERCTFLYCSTFFFSRILFLLLASSHKIGPCFHSLSTKFIKRCYVVLPKKSFLCCSLLKFGLLSDMPPRGQMYTRGVFLWGQHTSVPHRPQTIPKEVKRVNVLICES